MRLKHPLSPSIDVNGARLWRRLGDLARHGATPDGGVHRLALSRSEIAARRQLVAWGLDAGLTVSSDPAGNLFLRLAGSQNDAEPVLTGSYLDSQPNGGRYSGSYGMLAALEALAAIAATGATPRRPIVAAAWMNGEGVRFRPGYLGSAAFTGQLPLSQVLETRDRNGARVADALEGWRAATPDILRIALGFAVAAYLEVHLEQGPELEDRQRQIGVVSAMQGVRRYLVRVEGEAAHAGGMPRGRRRDALSAAVRIIAALETLYAAPDVTFTVGQLSVEPNAPSVVPHTATFSVDVRHGDTTVLARLGDAIRLVCESKKGPCSFSMLDVAATPSVAFHPHIQAACQNAAQRLNLSTLALVSQGGHDAQNFVGVCPSGILFIPCHRGISHSAAERIDADSALNGARVLAEVLWELSTK